MKAVYSISKIDYSKLYAITLNSLVPGNIRHAASNTSHSSTLNYFLYDGGKHQHKLKNTSTDKIPFYSVLIPPIPNDSLGWMWHTDCTSLI